MVFALVLGMVGGAMLPIQTTINTRLAKGLGSIIMASLVSFGVGTLALAIAVFGSGGHVPWATTAQAAPWWIWLGGPCGLIFLSLNIVLLPRIGASATVILPVVGQIFGGLVIDATAAFGSEHRALTGMRVIGAVLVLVGAALVNLSGRAPQMRVTTPRDDLQRAGLPVLWVLGILGGCVSAVQVAVNGRLGAVMHSPLSAAFVSFLFGTIGLVLIMAAMVIATRPSVHFSRSQPEWSYSGGLLGAVFVLANAVNAPILGTSLTVSVALLGQIVAGLTIDARGLLGVTRRPLSVGRLVGALVVLGGVVLVRMG